MWLEKNKGGENPERGVTEVAAGGKRQMEVCISKQGLWLLV